MSMYHGDPVTSPGAAAITRGVEPPSPVGSMAASNNMVALDRHDLGQQAQQLQQLQETVMLLAKEVKALSEAREASPRPVTTHFDDGILPGRLEWASRIQRGASRPGTAVLTIFTRTARLNGPTSAF